MNINEERKEAIISLHEEGVKKELLAVVTGISENTIQGIINSISPGTASKRAALEIGIKIVSWCKKNMLISFEQRRHKDKKSCH